jgi:probable selenium-dependent hydroxylase accessory protein YqeC
MTLKDALGLKPEEKMISFIGAGGKTMTLFCLGHNLYDQGQKVLVTTTTRIFKPTKPHVHKLYLVEDPKALMEALAAITEPSIVAAGHKLDGPRKLTGLPVEWFETLKTRGEIDWILIEADGAASRHFKVPAEHEPVVPDQCDVTIWLMSVKVLGQPLTSDWVHRAEKGAALLGVEVGAAITRDVILRLVEHPQGCLKGVPPKSRKIALINQADSPEEVDKAGELGHELVRHGFERAVITSYLTSDPVKAVLNVES